MVSTRSGKSTSPSTSANSVISVVIAKYPKRTKGKGKKESTSIRELEDLRTEKDTLDEEQQPVKIFTINTNSNRLSHHHLRFQSPEQKMSSSTTLTESTKSLVLSEKKNKREFEQIQDEEMFDIKITSTPLISDNSGAGSSSKKPRQSIFLMPLLPSLDTVVKQVFPTEDTLSISSNIPAPPLSLTSVLGGGIKKMIINEEEKAMNGAPEGELYDVILLSDSELPRITSPLSQTMIMDCFSLYFTLESKEGWAKQFEIVTFLRQLLYHHVQDVYGLFQEVSLRKEFIRLSMKVVYDSLISLRSSNIRNALFAIRLFFQPCTYQRLLNSSSSEERSDDFIWKLEEFSQLTTQLLMKTGNNPKFISNEAWLTIQQVIKEASFLYLLPSLSPVSASSVLPIFNESLLLNKNGDISMNGINLLEEKCKSSFSCKEELTTFLSVSSNSPGEEQSNSNLIKILYSCLTQAKKPQAKEKMKGLFSYFLSNYFSHNNEAFQSQILSQYLTIKETEEIMREITKASTINNITFKPAALPRTSSNKENSSSLLNVSKFSKPTGSLKNKILASKSSGGVSKPWKAAVDTNEPPVIDEMNVTEIKLYL
jgi:hypothetical protein